jgi:hypothetical protein
MKSKHLLGSAFAAVALSALLAPTAKAAGGNNDLYLGISDAASSNDYVVDIGTVASFISGTPFSINLNADLGSSSLFGSTYYTTDTSLTFGLAGFSGSTAAPSGLLLSDDVTPPVGFGSTGTTTIGKNIQTVISGFNNAAAAGSTPDPTFGVFSSNVSGAVIQPASEDSTQGHSYAVENPNVNGYGSGLDITTAVDGGVLDLYQLPKTSGGAATLLGTASISNAGLFTFNPATAAPEPSTYGLMALGLGALAFLRRRLTA